MPNTKTQQLRDCIIKAAREPRTIAEIEREPAVAKAAQAAKLKTRNMVRAMCASGLIDFHPITRTYSVKNRRDE